MPSTRDNYLCCVLCIQTWVSDRKALVILLKIYVLKSQVLPLSREIMPKAVLDTDIQKVNFDNDDSITPIFKYDIDDPIILILNYQKLMIIRYRELFFNRKIKKQGKVSKPTGNSYLC